LRDKELLVQLADGLGHLLLSQWNREWQCEFAGGLVGRPFGHREQRTVFLALDFKAEENGTYNVKHEEARGYWQDCSFVKGR
jgi:hypothetical protein